MSERAHSRRRYALVAMMAAVSVGALSGCKPPPLTKNGVVGSFGELGLAPGAFSYPRAITIGPDGSVYVVDKSARVQRFSPEGEFERQWTMPQKAAGKPVGMTMSDDGRLFVADTHYSRVIVYDRDGNELARFGHLGDGDGEFRLPTDVALDAQGRIYVAEYNGNDRITRWTPDYEFESVVVSGEVAGLPLSRPAGIDIDADQTLWVADACNHRVLRFDLDGKLLSAWGEMGLEPGQMRYPYDLTCTDDGQIMVCEYGNHRLQWFDKQGHSLRVWGSEGRRLGELWAPWGAAIGPDGRVYVVDSLNARVQIIRL
jgi:DNA-binding beta-propeller fold protein YncE